MNNSMLMKRILFSLSVLMASTSAVAFTPEIKTITLNDGEVIEARLCLPKNNVKTIVFCIAGTGPTTYLTKRASFNYFDELANGFCNEGIAFFSYNRRGCKTGETPPLFVEVDSARYAKYTPIQEAEDVERMISSLQKDHRFAGCKILLYGISEGTIIASLVAERKLVHVDALLLHGYAHENMYDIILWQNRGHGVMVMICSVFDKDGDHAISKEEYETEEKKAIRYKAYLFQNMPFDSLDKVKNGFIDVHDIEEMRMPFHEELMKRVTNNDWMWIRTNYFNITPQWFKSHFELEPNKTRLLRLNIPIHIFHGAEDANVPVESVYDLQVRFTVCNKENLIIHALEKHNHDLNFENWLTRKEWSEGFKQLFSVAKEI
ncbi:hypothetical protein MASR1M31_05430 [Porphyromonadaceae bacterium]